MAKKYPPGYVKDAKKVAAGKARAATAIKNSKGQYISRTLQNEITKTVLATKKIDVSKVSVDNEAQLRSIMKDAGVSKTDVKKFYEKHTFIFEDIIKRGRITGTPKFSTQLEKHISEYKGKIYINNGKEIREVTKTNAKLSLIRFKQYLSSTINVVEFSVQPQLTFDGKMILQIPDSRTLVKDLKEYFGVKSSDDLDDFSGAEITEAIENILEGMYTGKKQRREDDFEDDFEDDEVYISIYAS